MVSKQRGYAPSLLPQSEPRARVLIIEDVDELRESLAALFDTEGYQVVTARNGREAMHMLATHGQEPDVIVADLAMPVMDGLAFRTEQQRHPAVAEVPTIALTANEELRRHAQDVGFSATLCKPCAPSMLLSLVAHHCRRRARASP